MTLRSTASSSVRVAFGGICVGAFLLLTLLWARSYWWFDKVNAPRIGSLKVHVTSFKGWCTVTRTYNGRFNKWKRLSVSRDLKDAIAAAKAKVSVIQARDEAVIQKMKQETDRLTLKYEALRKRAEPLDGSNKLLAEGKAVKHQSSSLSNWLPAFQVRKNDVVILYTPFWPPLIVLGCFTILLFRKQGCQYSVKAMLILTAVFSLFLAVMLAFVRM